MDNIYGPVEDNSNTKSKVGLSQQLYRLLYMSQLKYDVAEFVINNRDQILDHLDRIMEPVFNCERIFAGYTEMYSSFVDRQRCTVLAHYLSEFFPCDLESLYLIVDPEFVKITLYS